MPVGEPPRMLGLAGASKISGRFRSGQEMVLVRDRHSAIVNIARKLLCDMGDEGLLAIGRKLRELRGCGRRTNEPRSQSCRCRIAQSSMFKADANILQPRINRKAAEFLSRI